MDALGPMRETLPGQLRQFRDDIQAMRLDLQIFIRTPLVNAFHENAACTTDIKKSAVPVQCFGKEASGSFPRFRVTRMTGLGIRIIRRKIGRLDEPGHRRMPSLFINSSLTQGAVDFGDFLPPAFFQGLQLWIKIMHMADGLRCDVVSVI